MPAFGGHFFGIHSMVHTKPALAHRVFVVLAMLALQVTHLEGAAAQEGPQLDLPHVTLSAGMHLIDAQLAVTPDQKQIGLMLRKAMPQHEGMLFVFDERTVQCFWMRNTLIPLTAAFVADDGVIVSLADMEPLTTKSHCSAKPVRYVLEMNQGWFHKRGIKAGFKLGGRPFDRTP
jgi:uncharacterized membrane protein (UPF0127 family)